jgi:hypothetical protein
VFFLVTVRPLIHGVRVGKIEAKGLRGEERISPRLRYRCSGGSSMILEMAREEF